MDNMIYAEKGTMKTAFTAMVWKNMGSNKNGWVQITKEQYEGSAPTGQPTSKPANVENEAKYRQLYEQGKGFEQDGKLADAKVKFEEALAIKSSPNLKGKINKLAKAIAEAAEAEKSKANRDELLSTAEAAMLEADFEGAIEAYEAAQELEATDDVAAKIAEAQQKLDDSLVE